MQTLPPNWTVHHDPESGADFFYNTNTGETQWEPPALQPQPQQPPSYPAPQHQHPPYPAAHPYHHQQQPHQLQLHQPQPQAQGMQMAPDEEEWWAKQQNGLTKDYMALAEDYRKFARYRDLGGSQECVLCKRARAVQVFFPCGHKAVCTACLQLHHITDDITAATKGGHHWPHCPLCNDNIKKIVVHDGVRDEEAVYWAWVNEVKPPLPPNFSLAFGKSSKLVRQASRKALGLHGGEDGGGGSGGGSGGGGGEEGRKRGRGRKIAPEGGGAVPKKKGGACVLS